ncbi:MAG: family 16 glycoside hydrolase [Nitrospirota bacterium]
MATSPRPQDTDFTKDVQGRYLCNGLDEALASGNPERYPGARPFDVIILGGGSFGAVVAQHLFARDATRRHRILVLEGGPFVLPEHIQNMPLAGLNPASATSIADLRQAGMDGMARNEVWGLAWHSDHKFPGLAYCLGGRSLYFGGWSPRLLDAEMPMPPWPPEVVAALKGQYFDEAARQIGTNITNDFINGPLHEALRERVYDGLRADEITDAMPLDGLPLELDDAPGLDPDLAKLDAPLAVQSASRSGFFPFNKFSSIPLLMKAAREAYAESGGDDSKKRLMIVPNCHITRLVTAGGRVTAVETNRGPVALPPEGIVVMALGTIENARLALVSFPNAPSSALIGKNLMAHLRSNLTIRIPRTALPIEASINELQASALFVKGRHQHTDGSAGFFHVQITASGLSAIGVDSERELFRKIPDLDGFDAFRAVTDTHVVVTIRGIGEMEAGNPRSAVTLDAESDEFGIRRAFVALAPTTKDQALWDAVDRASDDVALVLANGSSYEVQAEAGFLPVAAGQAASTVLAPARRRDGLGTTHHEAGTLWMGDHPATSVTNADGRLHDVVNAYVVGPALFPTIGSPNPMLTGVALARRLADQVTIEAIPSIEAGFEALFDGTDRSFQAWQAVGAGRFSLIDGTIVAEPGGDLGLLYYAAKRYNDFTLTLEFRLETVNDNSGIFVRFHDPRRLVPDRRDPTTMHRYHNQAWVAVDTGFEVQIDERALQEDQRTGAIYAVPIGASPGQQIYTRAAALRRGEWNTYEIQVNGDVYTVRLNGVQTTRMTNRDSYRGKSSAQDAASGYIGLQAHTGRVAFRAINIRPEPPTAPTKTEEEVYVEVTRAQARQQKTGASGRVGEGKKL